MINSSQELFEECQTFLKKFEIDFYQIIIEEYKVIKNLKDTTAKFGSIIKATDNENKVLNSVWNRTSFNNMQISDIIFEGNLEECFFESCFFSNVTFLNSTLINTFFKNRSLKRIRFIDCQADRMTFEFLKNGKADLTGITLLKP